MKTSSEPPPRSPRLRELSQDVYGIDEHHAFTAHSVDLQVLAHHIDHAGHVLANVGLVREKLLGAESEYGGDVFARLGTRL